MNVFDYFSKIVILNADNLTARGYLAMIGGIFDYYCLVMLLAVSE